MCDVKLDQQLSICDGLSSNIARPTKLEIRAQIKIQAVKTGTYVISLFSKVRRNKKKFSSSYYLSMYMCQGPGQDDLLVDMLIVRVLEACQGLSEHC